MSDVFAGDPATDGIRDRKEAGVRWVSLPPFERNGLNFAEAKRGIHRIEANRQIGAALPRTTGFIANEIAFWPCGAFAPNDYHAFRGIEVFLDIFAPVGAAADMGVPPDAETFRLKRRDQRPESCSILRFV